MIEEQTKDTPYVRLSVEECSMEIKGNSYAEGLQDLYNQILDWIDKEVPYLKNELNCIFYFNILSSMSMKNIIVIFTRLNEYFKKGVKIRIKWYYDGEDEDNVDTAHDLTGFIDIPFEIIEN